MSRVNIFLYAELSLYLKSVKQINMFAWLNHLSRQSQLSNMAGDVLAVLMGGQPKSYSLRIQRLYKRQKFFMAAGYWFYASKYASK